MARHDYECQECGKISYDTVNATDTMACTCGGNMIILWSYIARPHIGIHLKDRAVIWFNPANGKRATPGRNDIPMPERYRKAGYVRREFETLKSLDAYCKGNKLVNHQANYNNSGRAYDED